MADLLSIKPWILSAAIVFLIGGCSPKTSLHEAELIQLERVRTSFSEANISFIGRKQLALSEEDVAQVKSALEEANILVVSNSKRLEALGNLYLLENGEQIATFTFFDGGTYCFGNLYFRLRHGGLSTIISAAANGPSE